MPDPSTSIIDIPAAPESELDQMPSSGFFNLPKCRRRIRHRPSRCGRVGPAPMSRRGVTGEEHSRGWAMPRHLARTPAPPSPGWFNVSTLDATTPGGDLRVQQPRHDNMSGVHRWPDRDPHLPHLPSPCSIQIIDAAIAELQHLGIGNALALGNVGRVNLGLANVRWDST